MRILVYGLMFLFTVNCYSQENGFWGIKGGVGITNEISNLNLDFNKKIGYDLSAFYLIRNTNFLESRIGIGYIQKGYSDQKELHLFNADKREQLVYHYITAGPDFIFSNSTLSFKPYFLVGLKIDYLLAYKIHEGISIYGMQTAIEEIIEDFRELYLTGNIGAGLSFKSGFFIESSFYINLLNKVKVKSLNDPPIFRDYYLTSVRCKS